MKNLVQKLALLIVILISCALTFGFANAKKQINFTHPTEKEKQVFIKNETEIISGDIVTQEELEKAEISFDGLLWRNLEIEKNPDGYSFTYEWTVSGKGRFFIIVNAYTTGGDLIEGRILSEVYVPPDFEEENLKSMLYNYQIEQEVKQAKQKAALEKKEVSFFLVFESFVDNTLGEFLVRDWKALLPTKEQMEFAMNTTVYLYNFINTYQAGIDIFFLLTLPIGILLIILTFIFIYLDYFVKFLEYLLYLFKAPRGKNSQKIGILFDNYSLVRVPYAKVIFRNIQNNKKYDLVSDANGLMDMINLENGDYNYEVSKQNYKTHILNDFDLKYFQDMEVVKNNNLSITDEMRLSLPVERVTSLDRQYKNDKSSIFYKPKNWFLNSVTTWLSVGCLILILYMVFINLYYPIVLSIYFIFAYIIYYLVIKTHCSWGIVSILESGKATGTRLDLIRDEQLFASTWTDFEGKFDFNGIMSGKYKIEPEKNWEIVPTNRYYNGDYFDFGENKCLLKKNIILEKKSTK